MRSSIGPVWLQCLEGGPHFRDAMFGDANHVIGATDVAQRLNRVTFAEEEEEEEVAIVMRLVQRTKQRNRESQSMKARVKKPRT